MERLIKHKLLQKYDVVFFFLLGIVSTFPLDKWNSKFVFGLFIVQFYSILKKRLFKLNTTPFFWIIIALFSLNFIGLIYTENLSDGFTVITRQISFVLFPLFFASYNLKNIKLLLKVYCIAILIFIIAYESYTLYRFLYKSDIFPLDMKLFLSFRYTGSELTKLTEMHNAYFGMYVIFSNILIVSFLKSVKKNYVFALLLILILVQSLFIFQMIAKTAILLNILIILPSLIFYLIKLKKVKSLILLTLMILTIGWFSANKFNLPLNRIIDRFEELKNGENTIRETRTKLWKSSMLVIKDDFFIGVGTGDAHTELVEQFKKDELKANSNSHNQYIDYFIRFGVVGFLLFIGMLGFALFQSIKLNNYVYFCFLVLIIGSCFTENILSRQWGIIFFAFFNYLLYLNSYKNT